MKKIITLLLLLAATVTWSQNSTAAALTLSNTLLTTGTIGLSSGNVVTTTNATPLLNILSVLDTYTLTVDTDRDVNFEFTPALTLPSIILLDVFNNIVLDVTLNLNSFTSYLFGGTYLLKVTTLLPLSTPYQLTISTPAVQTPIPAAIWLFGSALLGLVSFTRRKS